jgi:hypothetical protein
MSKHAKAPLVEVPAPAASESTAPASLLDLSRPRTFRLNGQKGSFTLTTRRVDSKLWDAYFGALFITSEQQGKDIVKSVETEGARLLLAERSIIDAEGYKVAGDEVLTALPDWQRLLPLAHRLAVANLLTSAFVVRREADADLIYPNGTPVYLDSAWGCDDKGELQFFQGLCHTFKTPSEAQHRRYARAASRTRVLGGSRSGTTQYLGSHDTLIALYDELIVSVDGYAVDGKPLDSVDQIRNEMDARHKFTAMYSIFTPDKNAFATSQEEDNQE